jgi:hypothetical protein
MDAITLATHNFHADVSITLLFKGGPTACTPKRLRGADEAATLLAHLEAHWPAVWERYDVNAVVDALAAQLLSTGTTRLRLALEAGALASVPPRRGESGTSAASTLGDAS